MEDHKSKGWLDSLDGDVEGAKVIWDLSADYGSAKDVDVDAGWQLLSSKLETVSAPKVRKSTTSKILYWALASAAAALAFFYINTFGSNEADIEQYTNETSVLRTFVLADKSSISLYPGASLHFTNDGEQRIASLFGKASFEVSSDKSRPFIVNGPGFELVVVGTQFEVIAADKSSVNVTEGHVRLRGSREADWVDLFAGYSATIENQAVVNAVLPKGEQTGLLIFDGAPLEKVSERLKASGILELDIPDELLNCSVSADFTDSSIQEITESLAVLFSASVRQRGDHYALVGGSCQ